MPKAHAENSEFVQADAATLEEHLRAFASTFIIPQRRDRWLQLFLGPARKLGQEMNKLPAALVERLSRRLESREDWQASDRGFDGTTGIYFDEQKNAFNMTILEAETQATLRVRDVLFSIVPGQLALVFHHDGGTWLCQAPQSQRKGKS